MCLSAYTDNSVVRKRRQRRCCASCKGLKVRLSCQNESRHQKLKHKNWSNGSRDTAILKLARFFNQEFYLFSSSPDAHSQKRSHCWCQHSSLLGIFRTTLIVWMRSTGFYLTAVTWVTHQNCSSQYCNIMFENLKFPCGIIILLPSSNSTW